MSDELKHLKDAMQAATPEPSKKDADLALAMKNFDDFHHARQGSANTARPTSDRPGFLAGLKSGGIKMLHTLTSRGALAATTSIVAVGIGLFFYTQQDNTIFKLPAPKPVAQPVAQGAGPAVTATDDEVAAISEAPSVAERTERTAPAPRVRQPSGATAPAGQNAATEMAADKADAGQLGGVIAAEAPSAPAPQMLKSIASPQGKAGTYGEVIIAPPSAPNTEAFANADANPVKITRDEPVSTFSIDVDTASYAIVRSSLMNGYLPDPDSVRIEEMINYFPYDYPAPKAGEAPFKPTVTVLQTPWNSGTQLVHIAIQGEMPALDERPPLNLVFLIDTSGSMEDPNKLPLLKQSFRLMLSQLRPEDKVAIVTYAGSAGEVLKPTAASERSKILSALERLDAGGSTAGQAGLQQAYAVADGMKKDGEISRVILATDGDFNVGISDPEALKTYIEQKRESGTYLSVLGFGRGNLDDATMQALAQNGNGTAAYIDTLSEAQKVLVDQLTGALFPIADDVKIQVEFNPAQIAEYRLIGYETRALKREDFNNDTVDAGEIGAGTSVTAIYEITPVGSAAVLNDSLRYQADSAPATDDSTELGYLKLRWKEPGAHKSQLMATPILPDMGEANDDVRFSTAIAGFGQLLRGGKYLQDWGYTDAITLANGARGQDPYGYRTEAVQLMRLAQSLSGR